ncbi:MAG: HdeD family acid-resistance protein [Gaiellaceae bacterium]
MNAYWLQPREAAEAAARYWWLFIITGVGWLAVSMIIFRFDWTSVLAIGVLFGTIAIIAGVLEIAAGAASSGGWKVLHYLLGAIFLFVGVLSYFRPGGTFVALAALVSFFFVFAGAFDIVTSIATRTEVPFWWVQLVSGILEVALGFWAAGYWSRSVILLVAFVGASTVFRGVAAIVFGFKLLQLHRDPRMSTTPTAAARTPQPA